VFARRRQLADVACATNVSMLAIGPVLAALGGCRCGSFSAISIVNSSASMTNAAELVRGRFGDEQISALEGVAEDGSRMALRGRLITEKRPPEGALSSRYALRLRSTVFAPSPRSSVAAVSNGRRCRPADLPSAALSTTT
jgi:hypothetical protein